MNDRDPEPRCLTVKVWPELAELLGISKNKAYQLIRENEIRHLKIGRVYRVPRDAVEEYLRNGTR